MYFLTSLLNVAPEEIPFISHSVMLLDWPWVSQVFILISNVSCLLKRHFYRVLPFVCHGIVSICIQFSVVYMVNNCFHGVSICNFWLFTWQTIVSRSSYDTAVDYKCASETNSLFLEFSLWKHSIFTENCSEKGFSRWQSHPCAISIPTVLLLSSYHCYLRV